MTTTSEDECAAAVAAWEAAEWEYRSELDLYFSTRWSNEPAEPPEVLTPDALKRLRELRQAIGTAQEYYERVCSS